MVGKKRALNVIILVVAILLVSAIALRFYIAEERTLNFSGPNIYRAVYVYDAMEKQGFSVNLAFNGKWTDTNEKIDSSGLIADAELGSFTIILDNREVTVGGPFSSADDIQASSLSLIPNHKAVIKVGIEPMQFGEIYALNAVFDKFSVSVVPLLSIYEVGVKGDITLDAGQTVKPTIIQELNNVLRPGNEFVIFERGLIMHLENANLAELQSVNELFAKKGIGVEKVATGRLELFIRTKEIPKESRETLQKRAENSGLEIYLFKILTKPVQ